jgi:hypothetical protein
MPSILPALPIDFDDFDVGTHRDSTDKTKSAAGMNLALDGLLNHFSTQYIKLLLLPVVAAYPKAATIFRNHCLCETCK